MFLPFKNVEINIIFIFKNELRLKEAIEGTEWVVEPHYSQACTCFSLKCPVSPSQEGTATGGPYFLPKRK